MVPMSPFHTDADLEVLAHNIRVAATALSDGAGDTIEGLREMPEPDLQKFDAAPCGYAAAASQAIRCS
jgi:hypothetical protein